MQAPPFDGGKVRLGAGFPVLLKNLRHFAEALFDKGSNSGAPPPHSRSVGPAGQLLMSLPRTLLTGSLSTRSSVVACMSPDGSTARCRALTKQAVLGFLLKS